MDRRTFLGSALAAALVPALPAWAQDGGRKQIVVGQTADLSGVMQNIGRDYFTGAKMAFDVANGSSGSGLGHIRFVQLDDGGDPATAVANVKRLIEDERADVLFGLTAESCVEAVANSPAFRSSDVEIFAPVTGVDHAGCRGRAVYLRPNSAQEIGTIMGRLSDLSLTRIALVHSVNPSILAARNAILAGVKGQPYAEWITAVPLQEGGGNGAEVIATLEKKQTQAAIFLADSISSAQVIKQIRKRLPVLFVCMSSTVDSITVQQMLGPKMAQGLMVSRVVPDPENGVVPVVQEFKRVQKKYMDESLSAAGLEGYIAAQTMLSVMRKADSPRRLVAAAQRRGVLDLGGWKVNLAAARAVGRVEIAMIAADGRLI